MPILSQAQFVKFRDTPKLRHLFDKWQAESPVKLEDLPERLTEPRAKAKPKRK